MQCANAKRMYLSVNPMHLCARDFPHDYSKLVSDLRAQYVKQRIPADEMHLLQGFQRDILDKALVPIPA